MPTPNTAKLEGHTEILLKQENLSGAPYPDKDYRVETHWLDLDHLTATELSPADSLAFLRMRAEAMLAQGARESTE